MKKVFLISFLSLVVLNTLFAQKKRLTTTISKSTVIDSSTSPSKFFTIEFKDGSTKSGRLIGVNESTKKVEIANSSDTASVDFNKVYKVHKGTFRNQAGSLYQIDAPQRFFYTPMGNTMKKGEFALEDYLFLNNQFKAGVTDRLELGVGLTFFASQEPEDSTVSTFVMGTLKYKVIDRRHLKVAIGAEAIQLPPALLFVASQNQTRPPWFNILYAAANWEYKYMTFAFAASQGYLNGIPINQVGSLANSDRSSNYMVSASASIKAFPFLHIISENIYFAGAWNVLGNQNTLDKQNLVMPLIGGRYYGEYYSFGAGVSNVLIPNSIFFFYLGGSYYFL